MHKSTILRMNWFVENYVSGSGKKILDVGCMDQDCSYRKLFEKMQVQYIGLDIEHGPNVDIVMDEPYQWNSLKDESFDYVISGQAFEHIEYPWLTIKEIYKKMKPGGICCIIAPNTSGEHKMPLDCYRFFSDGLAALAKWAGFSIIDVTVSGIPCREVSPDWDSFDNDVCLIARKPERINDGEKIRAKEEKIYPKFKFERRIHGLLDQKLRYKCLLNWSDMPNRSEFLRKVLKENRAENAYIYGYDSLGKKVYQELKAMKGIETEVFDQHVYETEMGERCKREGEPLAEKASIMFITVLDSNRDLKCYLDSLYPSVPKFYLDEILEAEYLRNYFAKYSKVYLYGAGDYGRRVLKFLLANKLVPAGFVVSEGRRGSFAFDGYPIVEINELSPKEAGIIIATGFTYEKEIEYDLLEKGFTYQSCDVVGVYTSPLGYPHNSRED